MSDTVCCYGRWVPGVDGHRGTPWSASPRIIEVLGAHRPLLRSDALRPHPQSQTVSLPAAPQAWSPSARPGYDGYDRSASRRAARLSMKRIVWLTDPHLNFLRDEEVDSFLDRVAALERDAVLISGDIAESHNVVAYLERIADRLGAPIYFVLGNHDFYHGSIREVREKVAALSCRDPRLVWLSAADAIELTPRVGLVGHDGWADARLGDYERSLVMMNDYRLIAEFARMSKQERWPHLWREADAAAEHIRSVLPAALERFPRVVMLTHVPPFRDACWHNGQISDDEWLPHFTSKAMGDALVAIMREHPGRELIVLCGHTHGRGEARPASNIVVYTGAAEYGAPDIERILEFA